MEINYDRLDQFMALFTKEEKESWAEYRPEWLLEAMVWFMAQDPGHQELMKRLRDS